MSCSNSVTNIFFYCSKWKSKGGAAVTSGNHKAAEHLFPVPPTIFLCLVGFQEALSHFNNKGKWDHPLPRHPLSAALFEMVSGEEYRHCQTHERLTTGHFSSQTHWLVSASWLFYGPRKIFKYIYGEKKLHRKVLNICLDACSMSGRWSLHSELQGTRNKKQKKKKCKRTVRKTETATSQAKIHIGPLQNESHYT